MARLTYIARAAAGYFPLTWGGLIAVAAGLCLHYWLGEDRADYVALGGGLLLVGTVGLVAFTTFNAAIALALKVAPSRMPLRKGESPADRGKLILTDLETGAPRRTGFHVPTLPWWPFVEVSVAWESPAVAVAMEPGFVRGRAAERITPTRRGRFSKLVRVYTVADIFGLTSIRFPMTYPADLVISPASGRYSLSLAMRQSAGEGFSHPDGSAVGERADMRRYAAGDPSRFILWKAYARTRKLLVRMPERAIAPQPSTVAFLIAGEGDAAAAATARKFIDEGLLGKDAVFAADGAAGPASSDREALDQIVDSAERESDGGSGLATLMARLGRTKLSNCVIFAPSRGGAWEDHLTAFNRYLPAPATVIIGVDAPETLLAPTSNGEAPPGRWRSLLWAPPAKNEELAGLGGLVRRLQTEGMEVRLVHRGTGKLIDPSLIAATAASGRREAA